MNINCIKYFWLLTFVLVTKINSQTYFNAYQNLIETSEPKQLVKTVDSLIKLCNNEKKYTEKIDIAHKYSLAFYNENNYELAIKYGLIDIAGYEKNLKLSNAKYSSALFNLGLFYMENGTISLAISYFNKVVSENNYQKKVGQAYCQMGNCFYNIGDVYKSIDFYNKGLKILEKENLNLYTYNALRLSWIYEQINTPESLNSKITLLKHIEKLDSITPLNFTHQINLNNDIASYYDNDISFDFKKSRHYYQKNIDLSLQNNNQEHLGTIYTSLGSLYTYAVADSALYYFKKGLAFSKEKNTIARNFNLKAEYYLINKQAKKALAASDSALKASLDLENIDLDTINLIETSIDRDVTIWALIHKAEALIQLYYSSNSEIELIKNALFYLEKADTLITEINKNEFEEDSQLHWQEEAVKVYANAVISCHLLNRPDQAFNYIEKSKTLLLNQAISRNISHYQLPEKFNVKNYEFEERILDLKYVIDTTQNSVEKSKLQDTLFNTKHSYKLFTDSLKNAYPQYKTIDEQVKSVTTSKIQEQLDENSIIIAYSSPFNNLISNTIGIVSISKKTVRSFLIENSQDLRTLISSYNDLVSHPLTLEKDLKKYQQTAFRLYTKLIPNKLASKLGNKHIIIIPDGNLQHIPFEALITKENTSQYLIKSSMISYAYSMTSLLNNNAITRNASANFTAFSPITFKNENLAKLDYTEDETEQLLTITSGIKYHNDNATKTNFLDKSGDSKIIHLATHANSSNNPWIAFHDNKLQLHELYTYKNQANLVVLSACNTSTGKIAKGEGVLSLARGFFYSGAKSVVSTLWNVNDKSSSILITSFYKNLKKGEAKVTALHNAKLEYMSSHSLSENSPYYWASFVLIGDTDKVIFSTNYNHLLLPICGLILMFFAYFLFKKLKK